MEAIKLFDANILAAQPLSVIETLILLDPVNAQSIKDYYNDNQIAQIFASIGKAPLNPLAYKFFGNVEFVVSLHTRPGEKYYSEYINYYKLHIFTPEMRIATGLSAAILKTCLWCKVKHAFGKLLGDIHFSSKSSCGCEENCKKITELNNLVVYHAPAILAHLYNPEYAAFKKML